MATEQRVSIRIRLRVMLRWLPPPTTLVLQLLHLLHDPAHPHIQTEPTEIWVLTQILVPPWPQLEVRVHDAAILIISEGFVLDSTCGKAESILNHLLQPSKFTDEVSRKKLLPLFLQLPQRLHELLKLGAQAPSSRTRGGGGGAALLGFQWDRQVGEEVVHCLEQSRHVPGQHWGLRNALQFEIELYEVIDGSLQ